jgi:hypothetical protein
MTFDLVADLLIISSDKLKIKLALQNFIKTNNDSNQDRDHIYCLFDALENSKLIENLDLLELLLKSLLILTRKV